MRNSRSQQCEHGGDQAGPGAHGARVARQRPATAVRTWSQARSARARHPGRPAPTRGGWQVRGEPREFVPIAPGGVGRGHAFVALVQVRSPRARASSNVRTTASRSASEARIRGGVPAAAGTGRWPGTPATGSWISSSTSNRRSGEHSPVPVRRRVRRPAFDWLENVVVPGPGHLGFSPRGRVVELFSGPHGDAVPLAGRVVVHQQPRRRHRAGRRAPADRLADLRPVPRGHGRAAPAPALAAVRAVRGGARRPRRPPAARGDGGPGPRRGARRPHRRADHRPGGRRRRPRGDVPARHRGGLRRRRPARCCPWSWRRPTWASATPGWRPAR